MPVYVLYDGHLIEKRTRPAVVRAVSELPAPAVMALEAYASPIDGQPISSHRQREKDLNASESYDPRDAPAALRKIRDVRHQQQRQRPVTTEPERDRRTSL